MQISNIANTNVDNNKSTKIIKDQFVSPNFDERDNGLIDMIVIHSTHMPFADSVQRLCDPIAKVSSHYIIDLNGAIYQLVEDAYRAWHAGPSYWHGREALNDYSIGIEIVDTDDEINRISQFTLPQMLSVVSLCSRIIKSYKIRPHNIVAHSDIAPSRKDDPGENFDWRFLARHGVGIYHKVSIHESCNAAVAQYGDVSTSVHDIQVLLGKCGYKIEVSGIFDDATREVIIAFKRRFYPERMDDICDVNFQKILEDVASKTS